MRYFLHGIWGKAQLLIACMCDAYFGKSSIAFWHRLCSKVDGWMDGGMDDMNVCIFSI